MSIKVGNQTKRAVFYGGEKNMTKDEDMTIQVPFHFFPAGANIIESRKTAILP